jgi:hypothetical protein
MVVPGAPAEFDFDPVTRPDLERELVGWVDAMAGRISEQLPEIHQALEERRVWVGY